MAEELTDRQIADIALRTLHALRADWLPSAELRREMLAGYDDEDQPNLPLSRMAKLLRDHGERPEMRQYNNKNTAGYSRRQFTKVIEAWGEAVLQEEEAAHGHSVADCAPRVLAWIGSLDPDWAQRIEIMKSERGFDDKTILASLCAHVLENNLHMTLPAHEAVQGMYWTPDEVRCPVCDRLYLMKYPDQRTCLAPECGRAYHKLAKVGDEQM